MVAMVDTNPDLDIFFSHIVSAQWPALSPLMEFRGARPVPDGHRVEAGLRAQVGTGLPPAENDPVWADGPGGAQEVDAWPQAEGHGVQGSLSLRSPPSDSTTPPSQPRSSLCLGVTTAASLSLLERWGTWIVGIKKPILLSAKPPSPE